MSQDLSQEKFISSREGASLLGVPRQSFFYYVESRDIRKREVKDGEKDKYKYSYTDLLGIKDEVQARMQTRKQNKKKVDAVASQGNAITALHTEKVEFGATDWSTREDLPYLYVLDCDIYGIEYSVPPTKTLPWWEKNKTLIRVLYNPSNRKEMWGYLTILPMEEPIIYDLLRGDMSEQQIEPKHILDYTPGETYSCYVASIVIRPERRYAFNQLLKSVWTYWCDHADIHIKKLYGFAVGASEENDGMRLLKKLYFSPRYDIDQNAWELDLDRYNPSRLIHNFQKCLRQKQGKASQ